MKSNYLRPGTGKNIAKGRIIKGNLLTFGEAVIKNDLGEEKAIGIITIAGNSV